MESNTTFLIAIGGFTLVIFYHFFSDRRRFPPGPWGFPIIGNFFSIEKQMHLSFTKWAKTYGPIVMADLGMTRAIILNDIKLIRDAFIDPVLSGRPDNKGFNITAGGKIGIMFSDDDEWSEQRRFALRTLRDFEYGKKGMEAIIMDEVSDVLEWIRKRSGKPISVNRKFSLAVVNVLWTILASERYDHDDPKLNNILDTAIQCSHREADESRIPLLFPELAELFPGPTGWTKMVKAVAPMRHLFSKIVNDRLKNPGDVHNPRDFMDVYINEINRTKDPESSFYKGKGIASLKAVIGDLHGAGSETTSTTLSWAILYLMKFPHVQAKLQEEINRVVGKSRLPCLADKTKMPYSEAVMMEVMRLSTIIPMGVFHTAMADTVFHGYDIPKDTLIIANHYHVHTNPEIWIDPENFRPERFLTLDGKTVIKHEALIPFSVGKRVCLGESLARDEIFLFITSIFQRFAVTPDPFSLASLEPLSGSGFLRAPQSFTVIMNDRYE